MYSNYIVKVLRNNRPKTDFKYFSSLNNYRLAKICKPCGYVRDIPQHIHWSLALKNHYKMQIKCIHMNKYNVIIIKYSCIDAISIFNNPEAISSSPSQIDKYMMGTVSLKSQNSY